MSTAAWQGVTNCSKVPIQWFARASRCTNGSERLAPPTSTMPAKQTFLPKGAHNALRSRQRAACRRAAGEGSFKQRPTTSELKARSWQHQRPPQTWQGRVEQLDGRESLCARGRAWAWTHAAASCVSCRAAARAMLHVVSKSLASDREPAKRRERTTAATSRTCSLVVIRRSGGEHQSNGIACMRLSKAGRKSACAKTSGVIGWDTGCKACLRERLTRKGAWSRMCRERPTSGGHKTKALHSQASACHCGAAKKTLLMCMSSRRHCSVRGLAGGARCSGAGRQEGDTAVGPKENAVREALGAEAASGKRLQRQNCGRRRR